MKVHQSANARHIGTRKGKPVRVTGAALPKLKPGQVRCPYCHKGMTPTAFGALREHRDTAGDTCSGGGLRA